MSDTLNQALYDHAVVPVIVLTDSSQAKPLGQALIAGGLPVAEITFRSSAALEGIRQMAAAYPEMLVGAGTVMSVDQAKSALDAGAGFIVTPGFNTPVVDYCVAQGVPIYPGINGTGEIEAALERGLEVVKFFPAEALGGVTMLKALSGPYQNLKFMPTGGISLANLHDYLSLPSVVACGGSWLVPKGALASGDYDAITDLVRHTLKAVYGLEVRDGVARVTIPHPSRTEAYLKRTGVEYESRDGGMTMSGIDLSLGA